VDGASTLLLRANVAFQAVPVPAGQHRIRIIYSDAKFRTGVGISTSSLLLCALAFWHFRKSRGSVHNV
jgi:uncharacterized membrane protein YfhO